jgi:hypothetical protein
MIFAVFDSYRIFFYEIFYIYIEDPHYLILQLSRASTSLLIFQALWSYE